MVAAFKFGLLVAASAYCDLAAFHQLGSHFAQLRADALPRLVRGRRCDFCFEPAQLTP